MSASGEAVLDLSEAVEKTEKTAVWKSKDGDHNVTVLGDLGLGPDGRRYVAVQDTLTGLPLDELEL